MNVEIEFERECYKCYGTSAWMPDKQCDRCDLVLQAARDVLAAVEQGEESPG